MALNAERIALTVEVRQCQHDCYQPRRHDYFHRSRLAREDFSVNRMDDGVEPASSHQQLLSWLGTGVRVRHYN